MAPHRHAPERYNPHRYTSHDEDSARWNDFPFRDNDIIISTRSKSGTTWAQMICALLVFGSADLPDKLSQLSPWMDHLVEPRETVLARLASQQHRRFIKTHTPLDGIPVVPRADYLVVFRHPLDMAVSLYHQSQNIDRKRLRELTGAPQLTGPEKPMPPLREWLLAWIDAEVDPRERLDSLPGILLHLRDAWSRRDQSNVLLLHYADLSSDLHEQMRVIADQLGITVSEADWPGLVEAASFEHMKSRHEQLIPNTGGILKDGSAFFRTGRSGCGREILSESELAHYKQRIAGMAAPEALAWLNR